MRLRPGDAPLARHLALATASLLPLLAWLLRRFPDAPAALAQPCLLRTAVGLPCPTCGGTRAVVALAHGQPVTSLAANPLVAVSAAAVALWAIGGLLATAVPRWRRRVEASPGDGRRLVIAAAAAIAANWIWLLAS